MSDLTHLFKVGQKVKVKFSDELDGTRIYDGTVVKTDVDYILVDIPEVSDHCRFEDGCLDMIYPDYNKGVVI